MVHVKNEDQNIPGLGLADYKKDLSAESQSSDNGQEGVEESHEGGPTVKSGKRFRFWARRGFSGTKISKNIIRRRQNARLKALLTPKNSMMVLYELHPELKLTISEDVNATNQMTYTVKVEIGGRTFIGQGMSKAAAKQAASENALKSVLLEKLEQNNIRLSSSANSTCEDVEMSIVGDDSSEKKDGEEPKKPRRLIAEDDVPWGSLASFALYKLFSDWQSQGFQLPANAGIAGIFQKHVPPPTGATVKKLPVDANQKHPVQLLNQVRPGSQYIESREGVPPNLTFTFTVIVDGKAYKGTGTNKKDAKKQCAKSVLEAMGVVYD